MDKCCGNSLQTGTTLIAVVLDIIPAIFLLVHFFLGLYGLIVIGKVEEYATSVYYHDQIVIVVILGITGTLTLIFGIILLRGAQQKNITNCKIWLVWETVRLSLAGLTFLGGLGAASTGSVENEHVAANDLRRIMTGIFAVFIFIKIYAIWIVRRFKSELEADITNGPTTVGPYMKITA